MRKQQNLTQIEEEIESHDIISFDVFDTLIKRDCLVSLNVFQIVAEKSNCDYPFVKMRYQAEVDLYKKGKIPTLQEIYDEIDLSSEIKQKLMLMEQQVEIECSCASAHGMEIYQFAKKLGKKIIAISDMYLSEETIQAILIKNKYHVETIYVSCECQANKGSGQLFLQVLEELHIDAEAVLHIGDNEKADKFGAEKAGIDSVIIPALYHNTYYFNNGNMARVLKFLACRRGAGQTCEWIRKNARDFFEECYLYPFVNNHIAFLEDSLMRIGYETLGPVVYGFCNWIHEISHENQYERLLFCARDMKQTMEIYLQLFPEDKDKVKYLYVSLQSLRRPYNYIVGKDDSLEAEQQLSLFRQYMQSIGCKGKIALIDSGYGGTTLNMIETVMGEACKIDALYMRVKRKVKKNNPGKVYSYLFCHESAVRSYISGDFFETMLRTSDGRTLGYSLRNKEVVPVLGEDNPAKDLLCRIQSGISKFAEDWGKGLFYDRDIKYKSIQKAFLNFSFFPCKDDVLLLKDIPGGKDVTKIVLDMPENSCDLIQQMFFLKDTCWKGGFLVHNYKLGIPLAKIYLMLDSFILRFKGH